MKFQTMDKTRQNLRFTNRIIILSAFVLFIVLVTLLKIIL
jgi:uncharacterized membrane protein (DUF485 family)